MFRRLVRVAVVAGAVLLCASGANAQKSFVDDHLASEAVRLEAQLKTEATRTGADRPGAQARRDAEAALARGNPRGALGSAAAAVAAEPGDGQTWLVYARAAQAVVPRDWNERYSLQQRMTAAAFAAYQRATTKKDEAAALAVLGDVVCRARNVAARAQRLSRQPAARRRAGGSPHLRHPARDARLPDHRLQGRFRFRLAPGLLPVLGSARHREGGLRPVRRRLGRRQRRGLRRGLPALRRRAEAQPALRLRAAPGAAVRRRREPAQVGGLRGVRPGPLAAGAVHRPQLRPAADRAGGHPGRFRQHLPGGGRGLTGSATAALPRRSVPRISCRS